MNPLRTLATLGAVVALVLALSARTAFAVLDIQDKGPVLEAGNFVMRVTNIGVLGNAFFNQGLSFDPSFEFPRNSGHETLEHAELWVGATREDGSVNVSGGPMLEWRPTLDPSDVVRVRYAGDRGTRGGYDDDGDGRVDEEILNGVDDDGDGEIDEDIAFPAQQSAVCGYTDDQPEAVNYAYPNGERHVPLGLSVVQEAYAWSFPGSDKFAGLKFTITNHGDRTLHDVWIGVFANLDSRDRNDAGGHLNDVVERTRDTLTIFDGVSTIGVFSKQCFEHLAGEYVAVHDSKDPALPWSALVGLSHTTDPLGYIVNDAYTGAAAARARARAPRRDTAFTSTVFEMAQPSNQGGPPIADAGRYDALRGRVAGSPGIGPSDYAVLVSCGPFATLEPGQSIEADFAIVAAEDADSLRLAVENARLAYRGSRYNLQPDYPNNPSLYTHGETGINGHEICYNPPAGVDFFYDENCVQKFTLDPAYGPPYPSIPPEGIVEHHYVHDEPCVWSDFDCDACTGLDGRETVIPWFVRGPAPPGPRVRATPGDRTVRLEWDNLPEVLANANVIPGAGWTFWGYRIYRLDNWRRTSVLPPLTQWQMVQAFTVDSSLGSLPLASVLNPSVDYDSIAYEQKHYPVGRYAWTDTLALDGFDYHYIVSAVARSVVNIGGTPLPTFVESPLLANFKDVVRPQVAASDAAGRVWVVPNPFRAHAPWERPPVPGDVFTRHVDFFGLPRARATIRIWTLAGDLVQTLVHDGTGGAGEQAWDLISRNGQEVESGIYLFTVDSALGRQVGKFVVIR